jgi:hypothetical protein
MWSAPFAEKAVEYVSGAVELATVVRNFQRRLSRFTRNPTVKAAKLVYCSWLHKGSVLVLFEISRWDPNIEPQINVKRALPLIRGSALEARLNPFNSSLSRYPDCVWVACPDGSL